MWWWISDQCKKTTTYVCNSPPKAHPSQACYSMNGSVIAEINNFPKGSYIKQ
jgi:hypothetical protein